MANKYYDARLAMIWLVSFLFVVHVTRDVWVAAADGNTSGTREQLTDSNKVRVQAVKNDATHIQYVILKALHNTWMKLYTQHNKNMIWTTWNGC